MIDDWLIARVVAAARYSSFVAVVIVRGLSSQRYSSFINLQSSMM